MELILSRDPSRVFRRLIVLLAEGRGTIPEAMGWHCARKWEEAGKPDDWLFIVTGDKVLGPPSNFSKCLSNYNLREQVIQTYQEAVILYRALTFREVPADQILFENHSQNTYGQAVEVEKLLTRSVQGFTPLAERDVKLPVTLVCHDLHAARAEGIFEKAGYDVETRWTVQYHSGFEWRAKPIHMKLPRPLYAALEARQTQANREDGYLD